VDGATLEEPGTHDSDEGAGGLSGTFQDGPVWETHGVSHSHRGAQWTQQYLWVFHQPAAVRASLSESITKRWPRTESRKAWRKTTRSFTTSAPSCSGRGA
jgi:hypothetical protein